MASENGGYYSCSASHSTSVFIMLHSSNPAMVYHILYFICKLRIVWRGQQQQPAPAPIVCIFVYVHLWEWGKNKLFLKNIPNGLFAECCCGRHTYKFTFVSFFLFSLRRFEKFVFCTDWGNKQLPPYSIRVRVYLSAKFVLFLICYPQYGFSSCCCCLCGYEARLLLISEFLSHFFGSMVCRVAFNISTPSANQYEIPPFFSSYSQRSVIANENTVANNVLGLHVEQYRSW